MAPQIALLRGVGHQCFHIALERVDEGNEEGENKEKKRERKRREKKKTEEEENG